MDKVRSFCSPPPHSLNPRVLRQALFPYGYEMPLQKFYADTTARLIKEKSWSYDDGKTMNLDVVRDVTTVGFVKRAW